MKKIKISVVSYLNSKPFLYGIFKNDFDRFIDISLDYPAECARKLLNNEVDLGLIPVALIPNLKESHIISDYCIGTNGPVKTVCLFSDKPINEIKNIYLDYQSKTSVQLLQILLKDYWKSSPTLLHASHDYIKHIKGNTAGIVIGDRTIGLEKQFAFVYDLGAIWKEMTELPFVFAAWVSNKKLPEDFINSFNEILGDGIDSIKHVAQLFQSSHPGFDVLDYFSNNISYDFNESKKKGLELFLRLSGQAQGVVYLTNNK